MKTIFSINLLKVKEENDRRLFKKTKEINDYSLNNFEKKNLVLKTDESTTIHLIKNINLTMFGIKNGKDEVSNNGNNSSIMNSSLNNRYPISSFSKTYLNLTESTCLNSKSNIDIDKTFLNKNEKENIQEFKFNSLRADFYLKNNLYDIPLSLEILNYNHPPKYKINDELFAFLYPDKSITYCITITGFIANNTSLDNYSKKIDTKNSKYNFILGLYFCGRNEQVNIGDKIESKICKPNEFICKNCMNINKEKYNLKRNYLININGRIAKINKGSYHCFGNFLFENQIEQCIAKFSCNACKALNYYSKYYI